MSERTPPKYKIVYKRKGEPGITVAAVWAREWPDGSTSLSVSPILEKTERDPMTFIEALTKYAAKDGFLNMYEPRPRQEDVDPDPFNDIPD